MRVCCCEAVCVCVCVCVCKSVCELQWHFVQRTALRRFINARTNMYATASV
jgi:hypothetical protein